MRKLGKAELQEFKNTSSGVEVNWKEVANAENYRVGRRAENGKWKVLTNSATRKQLHGYHSRGRSDVLLYSKGNKW